MSLDQNTGCRPPALQVPWCWLQNRSASQLHCCLLMGIPSCRFIDLLEGGVVKRHHSVSFLPVALSASQRLQETQVRLRRGRTSVRCSGCLANVWNASVQSYGSRWKPDRRVTGWPTLEWLFICQSVALDRSSRCFGNQPAPDEFTEKGSHMSATPGATFSLSVSLRARLQMDMYSQVINTNHIILCSKCPKMTPSLLQCAYHNADSRHGTVGVICKYLPVVLLWTRWVGLDLQDNTRAWTFL